MEEQLLEKRKRENSTVDNNIENYENIRKINYSMILLVILASGYSVLFIIMAVNINSMTNNLDRIINVMDTIESKQINTTTVDYLHKDLILLKDCMLHKYCKRVPD
tara:strand:+ start:477 stop:794 length:318 start_codon:yes stop_codon:yes gene_type:complete